MGSLSTTLTTNQGTVNSGSHLIIMGSVIASTLSLTQSSGISSLSNPSTGTYLLTFPSTLFINMPYVITSAANAASGSYNFCTNNITLSSSDVYSITILTYSGVTGSSGSLPVLSSGVDFSFIILGH